MRAAHVPSRMPAGELVPGLAGETDVRQPGEDKQAVGGCAPETQASGGAWKTKRGKALDVATLVKLLGAWQLGGMLGEPLLSKRHIHKEGSAAPIRLGRGGNAAGNAALARRPAGTAAATWEWGPEQEAFSAAGPGLAQAARMFRP